MRYHRTRQVCRAHSSRPRSSDGLIEEECGDTLHFEQMSKIPQVHETTTPSTQRDARTHELVLRLRSHPELCRTRVAPGRTPGAPPVLTSVRRPWVAHQHTAQQYNVIHITTSLQHCLHFKESKDFRVLEYIYVLKCVFNVFSVITFFTGL